MPAAVDSLNNEENSSRYTKEDIHTIFRFVVFDFSHYLWVMSLPWETPLLAWFCAGISVVGKVLMIFMTQIFSKVAISGSHLQAGPHPFCKSTNSIGFLSLSFIGWLASREGGVLSCSVYISGMKTQTSSVLYCSYNQRVFFFHSSTTHACIHIFFKGFRTQESVLAIAHFFLCSNGQFENEIIPRLNSYLDILSKLKFPDSATILSAGTYILQVDYVLWLLNSCLFRKLHISFGKAIRLYCRVHWEVPPSIG